MNKIKFNKAKKIQWRKLGKIILMIDSANVIFSLKDLGWKIDYKKLQKYFEKNANLAGIYFYSAFLEEDQKQKNLFEMLSRKGFIIRTKLVKKIKTEQGIIYKGNLDTELVIDAIDQKNKYDTLILLSGDSDFAPLVTYLQKYKKKVISISSRGHVSKEIIVVSDKYLWLEGFRKVWELKISSKNHKAPQKRSSG